MGTPGIREILGWYGSDSPGTLTNLARILNHGKLDGIIKVKLPTAVSEQEPSRAVYERENIAIGTLEWRVRHVVESAFEGRRIVIFSGGPTEPKEKIFQEATVIRDGGGFGSIVGRNSLQRTKDRAVEFLDKTIAIYGGLPQLI